MKIGELTVYLEEIAPLHFQEDYDNAGLIYGDTEKEVNSILVSLDCTEEVVMEAISRGCNVIVSHHPIIFRGIKKFRSDQYVHRTVVAAIRHDIAIYAIHTNLDNVLYQGVNQKIAQKIGLSHVDILRKHPHNDTQHEYTVGSGVIGTIDSMSEQEFLTLLSQNMSLPLVRHTALLGKKVSKVAICGGAGRFLLDDAIHHKADVMITADVKYHEFFDADGKIVLCDIGHYESEFYTIELLVDIINNNFGNFASFSTNAVTNPVQYYISGR